MTTFTVTSVDFIAGICEVSFDLPTGGQDTITINPFSIAASNDATELQLRDAIAQMVERRLFELFPPAPPQPPALLAMVGQTFPLEAL